MTIVMTMMMMMMDDDTQVRDGNTLFSNAMD